MFEVQSAFGAFPSYTAAERLLHEDDPDAVNEPGFVLQRKKAEYKHLRPIKGAVLLGNYSKHWRMA